VSLKSKNTVQGSFPYAGNFWNWSWKLQVKCYSDNIGMLMFSAKSHKLQQNTDAVNPLLKFHPLITTQSSVISINKRQKIKTLYYVTYFNLF